MRTRSRTGLSVCSRSFASQRRAATGVARASKQTRKSSPSIAPRFGSPSAVSAYTPSASPSRVCSFRPRSAEEAKDLAAMGALRVLISNEPLIYRSTVRRGGGRAQGTCCHQRVRTAADAVASPATGCARRRRGVLGRRRRGLLDADQRGSGALASRIRPPLRGVLGAHPAHALGAEPLQHHVDEPLAGL